jgi:hypothetical protein
MYSSQQSQSQPELNNNWTKVSYHTNKVDEHKTKLIENPNTLKKAKTGSTELPLPITTQLY